LETHELPPRPVNVTLVAVVALMVGAYDVGSGVLELVDRSDSSGLAAGATLVALGVAAILLGLGAWRMRRWAWAGLMSWAVVGLMDQLLREFFFDHPEHLAMALDAFLVFMLTPIDVQLAFGTRVPPADTGAHEQVDPVKPAGIRSTAADVEILQAFEPVVRYTQGEKFFPMHVEPYVRGSSLWLHYPDGSDREIVPQDSLTPDGLVERRDAPFGALFYLRFVGPQGFQESAQALAGERRLAKQQGSEFRAGVGRLARGGLLPRLADGLFTLSLLLRGTVPHATAAAAALKYAAIHEQDPRFAYQGRVVRQGGWTICQYWFFFAYNPWRSGFNGVNDHESDWEMISVYLYEDGERLFPEWVAYASHDYHGADLRRRWDDRVDLEVVGQHPVVYAGAGSHASYFRRGEYQAEVSLPTPARFQGLSRAVGRFWRTTLGQSVETGNPLRIPFIDFARGDGVAVGPGQGNDWTPNVIDEETPWASRYHGLWGLFARDPISGENAPAGPMYERDGSPRPSWFDPLGFAELDQVPPPPHELDALEGERALVRARQDELDRLIPEASATLQELGVRIRSLHGSPHLAAEAVRLEALVAEESASLTGLRLERSANEAILDGLERRIEERKRGRSDDARAHIRNAAEPVSVAQMRFDRAAEVWAAISLSALLVGLAVVILVVPQKVWALLVVIVVAFVIGESVLRGTFLRTANQVAVILALIAGFVLFLHYWKFAFVALLIGLAVFLVYQRLRELRP
jgi:hypothetical protein